MTGKGIYQGSRSTAKARPCCHHWLVGPQGAATSPATCKRCGARREFQNGLDNARMGEDGRHPWSSLSDTDMPEAASSTAD